MKFFKLILFWCFTLLLTAFASCGGNDKKQPASNIIDTLNYHEELSAADSTDTLSVADSLLSAMQDVPAYIDDTAAFLLKQRLASDSSGKISDGIKKEIREAENYFRSKHRR